LKDVRTVRASLGLRAKPALGQAFAPHESSSTIIERRDAMSFRTWFAALQVARTFDRPGAFLNLTNTIVAGNILSPLAMTGSTLEPFVLLSIFDIT
jgi:hypothetical protein